MAMLTTVWRGASASVEPRWVTSRSMTTLALAASARTKCTFSPLGDRSIVVMPLPASAGVLRESGYVGPSRAVTVTVEPPHWRHPSSNFASCDWAAGGSPNAVTACMTWTDLRKLRVSSNSAAWYRRMALMVYASGAPGVTLSQHSGRSMPASLSDVTG